MEKTTIDFIIGFIIVLLVVAAIAIWLYVGDSSLKSGITNYVNTNIIQKLGGK